MFVSVVLFVLNFIFKKKVQEWWTRFFWLFHSQPWQPAIKIWKFFFLVLIYDSLSRFHSPWLWFLFFHFSNLNRFFRFGSWKSKIKNKKFQSITMMIDLCVCVYAYQTNNNYKERVRERERKPQMFLVIFNFFFVAVQIQIVLNHVLFFHSDGNFMLNQSKKSVVIQSYSLEKRERER